MRNWIAGLVIMLAGCGAAGARSAEPEATGEARVGIFERVGRYSICVSTQPHVDHYREVGGERRLLVYHREDDGQLVVARYVPTAPSMEALQGCDSVQRVEVDARPVEVRFARDEDDARALAAALAP